MADFVFEGRALRSWRTTGAVMSTTKRSETRVYSSGGGGYVNQHGGQINAPNVQSVTTTKHEFWLKKADGTETSFQLSAFDIPMREGQKVSVVSAGAAGASNGRIIGIVNLSARKHWHVEKAKVLVDVTGLIGSFWSTKATLWIGVPFLIFVMLVWSNNAANMPSMVMVALIAVPIVFAMIRLGQRATTRHRASEQVAKWIEENLQAAYAD